MRGGCFSAKVPRNRPIKLVLHDFGVCRSHRIIPASKIRLQPQPPASPHGTDQPVRNQALPVVRMTQGNGQGVRRIDLGFFQQLEQVHDHHLHLLLSAPPVPAMACLTCVAVYSAICRPASAPATMAAPRA